MKCTDATRALPDDRPLRGLYTDLPPQFLRSGYGPVIHYFKVQDPGYEAIQYYNPRTLYLRYTVL